MSMADEYVPARRLSIPTSSAIHGPYCPRRPNLREILANTSEPPWTLAAFMAYLSSNHCLETLEFTMDAGRYKKHYAKMMSKAGTSGTPPNKEREYVQALWERLVEAYIQPSGPREVNIPSDVRDPILRLRPGKLPPAPEALDPAVGKIYELMEESVLVPFLNSVYPQTANPTTVASCPSDGGIPIMGQRYKDRSPHGQRNRTHRDSPPPRTAIEPYSHSYTAPTMVERRSAPSGVSVNNKIQFNEYHRLAQSTSSPATASSSLANIDAVTSRTDTNAFGSGPGMTDDSGSTGSPANDSPTTPPATPPLGDGQSLNAKRDSGMWKKLGRLSKATKKKSDGGLREEQ